MTQRKDDQTPSQEGGRAAKRLRQFEESRAKPKRKEDSEENGHPESADHPSANQESAPEQGKDTSST